MQGRIGEALARLVDTVYHKLTYIDTAFNEDDVVKEFRPNHQMSLNAVTSAEPNAPAQDDVLAYIDNNSALHANTSMKSLKDRFTKAPYGFVDDDVEWIVAHLFKKGQISLTLNGAVLTLSAANGDEIARYITKREFLDKLLTSRKEHPKPELTTPLQRFIAAFAFCGPLQSSVETIGTRFLSRASDGVERAMHAPPPKVDVWGSGSSMEHIQKMKVIWDHLLNSSDGGREIDDPQLLLSMLIGKTITDIIMYGNIPAKDKLLEVEMVFAENRLELGTTAKEFVLDMANHGEAWKLVSQMMTPQGDQPPMFWQIAQIMSIKGNCKDELDNLIQEFMSFAYCFVSEIMKKYPNGGYDREKLLPYLKNLMPAEAPKN